MWAVRPIDMNAPPLPLARSQWRAEHHHAMRHMPGWLPCGGWKKASFSLYVCVGRYHTKPGLPRLTWGPANPHTRAHERERTSKSCAVCRDISDLNPRASCVDLPRRKNAFPTSPTTLDLTGEADRPCCSGPRSRVRWQQAAPRRSRECITHLERTLDDDRSRSRALIGLEPTMQLPPPQVALSQLPQLVPLASLQPPSESAASPPPQRRQRQRLQPERILPAQWSLKASSPRWWKMPAHVADSCNNFDTSHRKFLGEACVRLADVNQARGSKSAVLRDHQWQQSHFELRWNRYHSQVRRDDASGCAAGWDAKLTTRDGRSLCR